MVLIPKKRASSKLHFDCKKHIHQFPLLTLLEEKEVSSNMGTARYFYWIFSYIKQKQPTFFFAREA